MRSDAIFIGLEVADDVAADAAVAARLEEVCPVDIFSASDSGVQIVESNLDECVLCRLCIDAAPGKVVVHKLYSGESLS